jgi:ABC-type proline/glycine betaine transport system ATPase subunit
VRDIVLMKLNAVGLRGARDLMPSEISGGMARRVALARAIALDPELIMYDEPFAGLDPISLGTAAQLIRRLNDTLGITSIVVSHDLEETFHIADQVIILANGRIAAQGTPDEVRKRTDPLVRQFVRAKLMAQSVSTIPAPQWRKTSAEDWTHELVESRRRRFRHVRSKLGDWVLARACSCACWHASAPRFAGSAWSATRCTSWAITRWPSSRSPGLFVGFVLGLQGYYTLAALRLVRGAGIVGCAQPGA